MNRPPPHRRRLGLGSSTEAHSAPHVPVLLTEVLEALGPVDGGTYADGTFGAGGYSRAILQRADCRVLAIDRDPEAVRGADRLLADFPTRLTIVEARFGDLEAVARHTLARSTDTHSAGPEPLVDGVVLDVGVSSMQLDRAERGFSFMTEGPLDMRMGGEGPTAADLVAQVEEEQLARVILALGEERQARRIARAIVRARQREPLVTTRRLAELIAHTIGRDRGDDRHPATRTFQALRIWVNDELAELAAGLAAAERLLKPGGRLVLVTFHSLEDRIVKRFLQRRARPGPHGSRHAPPTSVPDFAPSFRLLYHRPLSPTEEEIAANPRARSAKLRAAVRMDAASWPAEDPADLGVPVIRSAG